MRRSLCAVLLLLAAGSAGAAESLQAQAQQIVRTTRLGKATLGLLVADLSTGEDLIGLNADTALIPASNLKLLTTAAALSRLGKDYVFSTELRIDGTSLVVRGSGDPAFCDPVILEEMGLTVQAVLDRWVEAARKGGLSSFDAILVDDRVFDQEFVHPNWPRNQLQSWYCAQVAGINFNDNCLDFYASPTRPGKPLTVRLVPEGLPMTLENRGLTGSGRPLEVTRVLGGNRIVVSGLASRASSNPEFITIHDPPMSFGFLLRERLRKAGLAVTDVRRLRLDEKPPAGRLLAAVETTLPAVLRRTNRDSQNLFAECLLKTLAHETTGRPGNWPDGLAAVRAFVCQAAGESSRELVLDDGSGLSRNNRVSPRLFVEVLAQVQRDPQLAAIYRDSLAQPGQRGTLRKRLTRGELNGQLYAKSGYINGTITLSGYLLTGGRTIAFSMLLNRFAGNGHDAHQMMEKIIKAVDRRYGIADRPVASDAHEPALGG